MTGFVEHDDAVARCAYCHDQCLSATPELAASGDQRLAVSRVAALGALLDTGRMSWTRDTAKFLFHGLNDGLQSEFCNFAHDGQRIEPYIRRVRAEAVHRGLAPAAVNTAARRVALTGNIFGRREALAQPTVSSSHTILLHDAATRVFNPAVIPAALAVIDAFGLEAQALAVPSGGLVELDMGHPDLARQAAHAVGDLIARLEVSRVVTTDPVLAFAIKFAYPYLGIVIEAQVLHVAEFLREGRAPAFRRNATTAVYHDPGALARGLGVTEAPRELLRAVPGLTLTEPATSGRHATSDGPLAVYPDERLARLISSRRLRQLQDAGADVIVTASPYSYANLSAVAEAVPVVDICSLLAQSLEDGATSHASSRRTAA